MGYINAGIYQAYINQRVQCDVQAAFLGRPSPTAVIKAVSYMSRFVDPRAPTEADLTELAAIRANPEVVQLKELRDNLSREVRQESGTIQKGKEQGTKLYQMYKKTSDNL